MKSMEFFIKIPTGLKKFEHTITIKSNKVQKRIDKINKIFYEYRSN
jgi:hypothetical protein